MAAMSPTSRLALRPGGRSIDDDAALMRWTDEAAMAAARLAENKFARIKAEMARLAGEERPPADALRMAIDVVHDEAEVELNRQVLLAALLRGRYATSRDAGPMVLADGLFEMLPFIEAIGAFLQKLVIDKVEFESLDTAARSQAFTMAWVGDQQVLEQVYDGLSNIMAEGGSWPEFEAELANIQNRTGWTGTNPWHYRLVYDMQTGMAYSAGRYQQGEKLGLQAWRYLESAALSPRDEHQVYYGMLFRAAPGKPMPPIDFNCLCGWEWVLPDELEAMGVDPALLPVFDPPVPASGFRWSATDYLAAKEAAPSVLVLGDALATLHEPPDRILLSPWGHVQTTKGDYVMDEAAAETVVNEFRLRGVDLVVDYEHQSLTGETAPAAGWVKRMVIEPGTGLIGIVEWTPRGKELIASGEYRYLSPVMIVSAATRAALRLHSVALTNIPATLAAPPIAA